LKKAHLGFLGSFDRSSLVLQANYLKNQLVGNFFLVNPNTPGLCAKRLCARALFNKAISIPTMFYTPSCYYHPQHSNTTVWANKAKTPLNKYRYFRHSSIFLFTYFQRLCSTQFAINVANFIILYFVVQK